MSDIANMTVQGHVCLDPKALNLPSVPRQIFTYLHILEQLMKLWNVLLKQK